MGGEVPESERTSAAADAIQEHYINLHNIVYFPMKPNEHNERSRAT